MPPELMEKNIMNQLEPKATTHQRNQDDAKQTGESPRESPPASPTKRAKKISSSREARLKVIDTAIATAVETKKIDICQSRSNLLKSENINE